MSSDTPPAESGPQVRLGLLDGTERSGTLHAFTAQARELVLVREGAAPDEAPARLPASCVAWVAFARSTSVPTQASVFPRVRVELCSGRSFVVDALDDPRGPLGFRGRPVDSGSPWQEFFFYGHAVRTVESEESLGDMLLADGAVTEQQLSAGFSVQLNLGRRRIGEILLEHGALQPTALDRGVVISQRKGMRLGEVLVEEGLVTREQVDAALAEQRRHKGRRIGEILMAQGILSEEALARTLARKFHLPLVDLDQCLIVPEAIQAVPRGILEKHRILPIDLDERWITVALSDPLNTEPIDLIRFRRPERIREVVAVPSQLARYLETFLSKGQSDETAGAMGQVLQQIDVQAGAAEPEEEDDGSLDTRESDNAIIQLANQIIVEAVRRGASDIHVEPNGARSGVRMRFRIDGQCIALPDVPASYRQALVSRLKIMANLDIAERRIPQDGKIRIRLPDKTVELRVATIPTVGGEDVVLRVLAASKPLPMTGMDLTERNRTELERLIKRPYGLVLCVGPTGSGKTTSLHSVLGHINTAERKIWTAEDPVEITQAGLRQVQVRPKIGFGFAEALRSFLRADPDVIMVGEMRDHETAAMGIEASLTGHLVFSTLHTNSAPETVVRLIDMGLDPFSFGDALLGVLAQRLARRLCPSCRSLEPAPEPDREALQAALGEGDGEASAGPLLWRARGCGECRSTGYRGRVALHELLVVDDALRSAIHAKAPAERIRELAMAGGMTTLLQDGARKCVDGLTDLEQVLAVCAR